MPSIIKNTLILRKKVGTMYNETSSVNIQVFQCIWGYCGRVVIYCLTVILLLPHRLRSRVFNSCGIIVLLCANHCAKEAPSDKIRPINHYLEILTVINRCHETPH